MRVSWIAGPLLGLAALSAPATGQTGQRAPEFNAARWYNSPPLTMELAEARQYLDAMQGLFVTLASRVEAESG